MVLPFGAKLTTNCPVKGLMLPNPVTRSLFACLQDIIGCSPTGDQVEDRVAVLLNENSSSNKRTVS